MKNLFMGVLVFISISFIGANFNTIAFAMGSRPPAHKKYCETKYPIMLVPGTAGFKTLVGFVDYWWQIPRNLERSGAVVRCASVSAVNSTEVRGEQLLKQVEDFLAETGKEKVHLIGHSHGTVTARYVAGVRPDIVASVTCIAGMHREMPWHNLYDDFPEFLKDAMYYGLDLFGYGMDFLGGTSWPQDGRGMMDTYSEEWNKTFNQKFPHGVPIEDDQKEGDYYAYVPELDGSDISPDEHLIRFYSWTGSASGATNIFDFTDVICVFLDSFSKIIWTDEYIERAGPIASDSFVTVWSSRFGKVIREDYYWNHIDEINMMFGIISPFASNPVSVMRQHANRLKLDEARPLPPK